ncbi:hypothetical protein CPB84DRAFT_1828985 [Gymnopilus junonius]|uniref:Uncharacterized protein n=1 Tax=Gymnopilus junonius TaxID=109634 RepID=A0A9P5THF5_GYMJU|nr:hypothetical protein CPB84DRAFT_1828985 [Gymnopilus junonius]
MQVIVVGSVILGSWLPLNPEQFSPRRLVLSVALAVFDVGMSNFHLVVQLVLQTGDWFTSLGNYQLFTGKESNITIISSTRSASVGVTGLAEGREAMQVELYTPFELFYELNGTWTVETRSINPHPLFQECNSSNPAFPLRLQVKGISTQHSSLAIQTLDPTKMCLMGQKFFHILREKMPTLHHRKARESPSDMDMNTGLVLGFHSPLRLMCLCSDVERFAEAENFKLQDGEPWQTDLYSRILVRLELYGLGTLELGLVLRILEVLTPVQGLDPAYDFLQSPTSGDLLTTSAKHLHRAWKSSPVIYPLTTRCNGQVIAEFAGISLPQQNGSH